MHHVQAVSHPAAAAASDCCCMKSLHRMPGATGLNAVGGHTCDAQVSFLDVEPHSCTSNVRRAVLMTSWHQVPWQVVLVDVLQL
jgi:hypothetical protein